MNYYLTQAIAIGHDIGHTPFGHQGERTLNRILTGEISIIKNLDLFNDNFGGFKHNYQSIRVATKLEEEYAGIYGIDLSLQTLEGKLLHKGTLIRIMNEFKRHTNNVIDFTNSNYEVVSDELNTIVNADLNIFSQFDDNKKKRVCV